MGAVAERVDELMSDAEVVHLTDASRAPKQSAWLAEHKIPHQVDGRRVLVSRFHVRAWLEGRLLAASTGPNWDAMN